MSKRGGSEVKRLKGQALQKLRLAMYIANPCCNLCSRLTKHPEGYEVDHIKPLHQGGTDTEDNRQLLCIECHDKKTASEMGYEYQAPVTIGLDGWPIEAPTKPHTRR